MTEGQALLREEIGTGQSLSSILGVHVAQMDNVASRDKHERGPLWKRRYEME